MNKKFRKLILPASLLIASQSFALGLGGLQIDSSLDEVLSGEIPFIIDSSEEIESIEVSVASFAEYKKVNLDKSYVPTNIQVEVVERNGQKYVQVSSVGPVSEPIVSLLLVVDWSNGRLLREFTILLDPPLFNNTQTNEYSKPVETNTYVAPQQIESQSQPVTQTSRQASRQISASNYTGSSQIVVESGDTLWRIASRYNDGSSTQQMMVAIFNNNSEAFLNDDMNQLRKGAVLTIPDSDQVSMISNGQAVSEVRSHMQKWSRLQTADSSTNSNNSSTTDFGIELVPPSDSDSSESYNSSGTSTSSRVNTKTIADLNRAKEELISSSLENSELSSRVSELERIIEDQKLALSLKDSDLAQLQEMLKEDGEMDPTSLDTMSDTMSETMSDTPSDTMTTDDVWDDMQSDSTEMSDISGSESMDDTNSEMMDDSEMVDETMHEDSMEDSMDSETSDTVVIEDVEQDTLDTQPDIAQPIKKEPSFLEKIMQYKFEGLIGLGALLLGLLGFVFFKRRGENASSDADGFLDSISNDGDNDGDNNVDLDDFNSSLDSNSTELDLTNLEDFDDLDDLDDLEDRELSEVTQQGEDLSEEVPEVVVMNDSEDELNDGLDDDLADLDELDLDLEFGLDDDLESDSEPSEQTDDDSENTELEFDLEEDLSEEQEEKDSEDLSLDFELDDLDLDDESSDEFEFDLDVSSEDLDKVTDDPEELDELVFDTGERTIVDAVETIGDEVQEVADVDNDDLPDLEFDLSDDLFDTDDLDLGLDSESDSDSIEKDDVTELNLESLDEENLASEFNLDDSGDVEEPDEDVDIGLDFDDLASDDDDAIDTKLDLAKAYFEMGDVDGAQQMVNEIIEEGNDEQKSKAEELKTEIEGS